MTGLAGIRPLIGLVLRRDRWILPVWVLLMTAFVAGTASSFAAAYPTEQAQQDFIATVAGNPAITAIIGPVLGPGIGGLVAWRIGTAGSMIVAAIAVVAVLRHTRAEEATGRAELARSAAVSRFAPLTAALLVVDAALLVTALLIGTALAAQGLPAPSSFALGLSLAAVGWVFAGLAALTGELSSTSRTATGLALAVLAVAIVMRMGADAGGSAGRLSPLVWLTPVGWMPQMLPFAGTRWWVLGLFLATTAVLTATAYRIRARRDINTGVLAERPGPAHAGNGLQGVFGLAWRQHRGLLAGVVTGYALLGLLVGSAADGAANAGPQLGPSLARLGVTDSAEALVVLLIYVLAEVLAAYAIVTTLRPRYEETSGLAAVLLTSGTSRTRWMLSQLAVVALGTAAAMLVLGLTVGLAHGVAGGDVPGQLAVALTAALSKIPPVWVLAGVSALLLGLVPRASVALSWAVLALVLLLEIGWELGQISDQVFAISPFSWVFPLAGRSTVGAVVGLTVVAVLFSTVGLVALRRRDLG